MIKRDNIDFSTKSNEILICDEDFAYFSSCPKLRTLISNYTITFPNKEMLSDNYTIIPHGSATLVYTYDGNTLEGQLFGPMSKPCVVGKKANACTLIFIIEFQPAGLYVFTGRKQNELIDQTLPFEDINRVLDELIKEVIYQSDTVEEILKKVEALFLENQSYTYPPEFNLAIQSIIDHCGNIKPKEISEITFYSERHINRLFHRYLGMNMKHFSRIVRVNKAIHLLNNMQNSLSYVYRTVGFYDLSHFIKDFKSVCGITPQAYRQNMSDFYSEIAKF